MGSASIVDSGGTYENTSNLGGAFSVNDITRPCMDSAGSPEHAPTFDMLEAAYGLEGASRSDSGLLLDSELTGNPVNYKTARAEHSAIRLLESMVSFLGAIGLCLFIFLFYAIFLGSGSVYLVYALFIDAIFVVLLLLFIRLLRGLQSRPAPLT